MSMTRLPALIGMLVALPLLSACENSATSYIVDTNQHALILIREQPYFWTATVDQSLIVSRLPHCQRKVKIHPDAKALTEIEVFEAGALLWALRQGNRWYLASTEQCLVQDWDNASGAAPGDLVGTFRLRDGSPAFFRAGG